MKVVLNPLVRGEKVPRILGDKAGRMKCPDGVPEANAACEILAIVRAHADDNRFFAAAGI